MVYQEQPHMEVLIQIKSDNSTKDICSKNRNKHSTDFNEAFP